MALKWFLSCVCSYMTCQRPAAVELFITKIIRTLDYLTITITISLTIPFSTITLSIILVIDFIICIIIKKKYEWNNLIKIESAHRNDLKFSNIISGINSFSTEEL